MQRRPRAALVEFSGSHVETMPLQAWALHRAGFEVDLLIDGRAADRLAVCRDFASIIDLGRRGQRAVLRAFLRHMRRRYDLLVFNTAHGPHVRNLAWLAALTPGRRAGLVHIADKARDAWSTRAGLLACDAVFTLSEHLSRFVAQHLPMPVGWFHPVLHEVPPQAVTPPTIDLAVVGSVDPVRRDYRSLVEVLADPRLDARVRILALGACDRRRPEVAAWIEEIGRRGLQNRLVISERFLSEPEMQQALAGCGGLLLLMHPGCDRYENFVEYQVSGACGVALAHRLPILVEEGMAASLRCMGSALVPYPVSGMVEAINAVARQGRETTRLAIARDPAASVHAQAARYLRAVAGLNPPPA